jgi:ferredoxin
MARCDGKVTGWAEVDAAARAEGLFVAGGLHDGGGTVLLLSPDEPGFWPRFRSGPEAGDGRPDPMDRWSRRVIGVLAAAFGARAVLPSDGPPYAPFYRWALDSGRVHASPVRLLVHAERGLMTSFRGAVVFRGAMDLPPALPCPCDGCAGRPCLTACPPGALTGAGYDVAACHDFLDSAAGAGCMGRGCAVRRACPVGQGLRPEAQSAFHMASFHRRPE